MGGQRTHRLLFAALTVVLAGVLALPAKLSPSPDRSRVAVGFGPSTGTARQGSGSSSAPSPPPRREHAIQTPDDSGPAAASDATSG
ncbi:MAG: hypothetical protein QOD92_1643, partial [Acidimicrobiaceae bacterium]